MANPKSTANHAHMTYHERFTLAQRIEHIILILSFTTLGVTGLAQKFVGNSIAEGLIALLGGIETVRIIHRIAAVVLALQSIYHVLVLGHKIWVRRVRMTMLPGLKDLTDAIDVVRYNLGLSREHPKMPRYNFGEKVEYWAMVWGTIIMGVTGFMLWNAIATSKFLPGNIIPAAKAAHGAEALLAVLAILIWHFYNVHVKMLNKSMFTGKMAQHQMEEEHGQELEERVAGHAHRVADPVGIRRRERIYLPVAIVAGLALAAGLLWFATFEETAIATLPVPATQVPVFAPLTPTPQAAGPTAVAASLIPHPIEGQEACDACHATGPGRLLFARHRAAGRQGRLEFPAPAIEVVPAGFPLAVLPGHPAAGFAWPFRHGEPTSCPGNPAWTARFKVGRTIVRGVLAVKPIKPPAGHVIYSIISII